MKSFAIIALIATATAATAANAINADTIKAHAEQFKAAAEAQGCDWPACIASVAGLSIACGSAAAEAGLSTSLFSHFPFYVEPSTKSNANIIRPNC